MLNYALEGPKWTSSVITWQFAAAGNQTFTGSIGPDYQDSIRAAAAQWSAATNVTLQEVAPGTANADITVGWSAFGGTQVGETAYAYSLGAAQSFLPGMTIQIEDPSLLPLGTANGDTYQGTVTTLEEVALHEFGHALGLGLSTDASAVMNIRLGSGNAAIGASDLAGIAALYGTRNGVTAATSTGAGPDTVALNSGSIGVYRFFDGVNGTQLLTSSLNEMNSIFATRPDLKFEGLAVAGLAATSDDPDASPIYRFYDTSNGAHFLTASRTEADTIASSRPDLVAEPSSFNERTVPRAGDVAVYRFFDTHAGTHFFTADTSERDTIGATRIDLTYEGVAFYAPAPA